MSQQNSMARVAITGMSTADWVAATSLKRVTMIGRKNAVGKSG